MTMLPSANAGDSAAQRRGLALVWNADLPIGPALQPALLARWILRGIPAEPRSASASDLARYFSRLPPQFVLHIEHRLAPASTAAAGYTCQLALMGPPSTPASEVEAVGEALAAFSPGLWIERVGADSLASVDEWPRVVVITPTPVRLWHVPTSVPGEPTSSQPHEAPYPAMWPNRPLTVPLADQGSLRHGIGLVQRIRSFVLDEPGQAQVHATMRRIQAGALRCYGKDSPLSPYGADPALRQALAALIQQWLISPRGWCFDMEIRAERDLSATAIERIARDVFGNTPFGIFGPEKATFPDDLSRASLPAQGLPAIWPDIALARSLGITAFYAAPATALSTQGSVIGRTAAGPASVPVHLDNDARTRHVAIVGSSGSAKTTLMLSMFGKDAADPYRRCGAGLIVENTQDATRALGLLPSHCIDDLIYVDFSDPSHVHCMNPLQGMRDNPARAYRSANSFCYLVKSDVETHNSAGPMIDSVVGKLVGMGGRRRDRNGTLMDMTRALEDRRFLDALMANSLDQQAVANWKQLMLASGDNGYQTWVPYTHARFAPWTSSPSSKRFLGRPNSTIDLLKVMNERKIIIFNLSKDILQDIECRAIGSIILMMFHEAALSRGALAADDCPQFHLYVDEFQSFAGESVGRMFAELRKFKVGLCVSIQQTSQLVSRWGRQSVLDAVLANTASKFVFRLGMSDVGTMASYFSPAVSGAEIARLPDFHAVATLPHRGRSGAPFVMQVTPPEPPPDAPGADAVREYARAKATPIEQANEELIRLYDLHPGALG